VRPVTSRRDRNRFIKLPYSLHADDPSWVPPLLMAEKALMNPAKNPFFQFARMQMFLAWRDGRVVGRVAAIDNDRHNEIHGDNVAFFGFFEAEDEAVARALLEAAEQWARDLGRSILRGPANPSFNDTVGLQVDTFDQRPYIMMVSNPPTYPQWVEAAGYVGVKDLLAFYFDASWGLSDRAKRILQRQWKRLDPQPVMRPMRKAHFIEDMEIVRNIFTQAWKDNWGFVPPTEEEFRHAAGDMKQIILWDWALIMEIGGEPAAFSVTLPDINQVLARMNGRLFPSGIFKLLNRWRYIDRGRLLLLGVLPRYRNKGLELMLMERSLQVAKERGFTGGECSWTLEDNDGINNAIRLAGGKDSKRFRVYEKALG
jgi:GNAT superfamily N-acetyltransferase